MVFFGSGRIRVDFKWNFPVWVGLHDDGNNFGHVCIGLRFYRIFKFGLSCISTEIISSCSNQENYGLMDFFLSGSILGLASK